MTTKNSIISRQEKNHVRCEVISAGDREKIWQAIDAGDHTAEIAMICIYTGLRALELLEIKKDDVNLSERMVLIVGGKAGSRRVPIHTCILPYIEKMMQTEGEYLISIPETGEKMSYERFTRHYWTPLMRRLGMQYTPHHARHTCVAMLRESIGETYLSRLILGLANGGITGLYTHYTDPMLLETIDALPGRETEG